MASTSQPSARSRSTSVEPMKPGAARDHHAHGVTRPAARLEKARRRRRLGRAESCDGACPRRARRRRARRPTHDGVVGRDRARAPSAAPAPTTESIASASVGEDGTVVHHRAHTRARRRRPTRRRRPRSPRPARRRRPRVPSPISTGASSRASASTSGVALHPHPGRSLARAGRGRAAEHAGEHVGVRLQVLLGRADVDPVGVARHRVEAARLLEHARERLALDRDRQPLGDALQHRRLEHVGAGVDPVGGRLALAAASRRTRPPRRRRGWAPRRTPTDRRPG